MKNIARKQRLILLSILLLLLLTYPFISIANKATLINGFPLLYIYVFVVWIIAIVILYKLAGRQKTKRDE